MKIQITVTARDENSKTFAPAMKFDFNVKPVSGKRIGQQIKELKKKAMDLALDKSGLAKYDNWEFRSYLKDNPYIKSYGSRIKV